MSSTRDVSHLTDITKRPLEPDGTFRRRTTSFRDFIQKDGKYEPEKAATTFTSLTRAVCLPSCITMIHHSDIGIAAWATRALIVRKLKGLEDFIGVSVVSPRMGPKGWPFASADAYMGADADLLYDAQHVSDLYLRAKPDYDGRFSVPILWDKKTATIVNNESSEIIRMFNSMFDDQLPADKAAVDLYPEALRKEIDEINEGVYDTVNNGVYKSGFATIQTAYEAAVVPLFASLDRLEKVLTGKDFLVGDRLTEADIRLFVTIVRFDPVYVGHFKCNIRTIRDGYPAIHLWLRKLYWNNSAFSSTCDFDHIKTHYYWSHPSINPHRVIPAGPVPNILPL